MIKYTFTNYWISIRYLGIRFCCLICINQRDSKSLAAYSSIVHIRFLLLSLLLISNLSKTIRILIILGHGYTSTLIFYIIGKMSHTKINRKIYYLNSLLITINAASLVIILIILSNRGFPPSLSFLFEFIRIRVGITKRYITFLIFIIYFILSFYYSIYYLVNTIIGKNTIELDTNIFISYFILIIAYNLLYINILL
jgi:NADH:ubiquinone oxidoreductase subunit 4 (subunit M)